MKPRAGTVREAPIYRVLIDMGVMEVEIPKGFNSIYIPTEGSDPTFYSLSEQNDETTDERWRSRANRLI